MPFCGGLSAKAVNSFKALVLTIWQSPRKKYLADTYFEYGLYNFPQVEF